MDLASFQETVWNFYHDNERDLPWRKADADGSFNPYFVMVSEIMLQQTQAQRVIPKYQQFILRFPTVGSLALADLSEVLKQWSGLGYNRRAKFLWQAARMITDDFLGVFPDTVERLIKLPGIGVNTAAAILAYSHNQPVVFIETNIRTVYIHHFFADVLDVTDAEILVLVEATVDREHPREWYWALMDYGVYIKRNFGNASRSSKHYAKQSAFHGSKRQIRGLVIRSLTDGPRSYDDLKAIVSDDRFAAVIEVLVAESLITKDRDMLSL